MAPTMTIGALAVVDGLTVMGLGLDPLGGDPTWSADRVCLPTMTLFRRKVRGVEVSQDKEGQSAPGPNGQTTGQTNQPPGTPEWWPRARRCQN